MEKWRKQGGTVSVVREHVRLSDVEIRLMIGQEADKMVKKKIHYRYVSIVSSTVRRRTNTMPAPLSVRLKKGNSPKAKTSPKRNPNRRKWKRQLTNRLVDLTAAQCSVSVPKWQNG